MNLKLIRAFLRPALDYASMGAGIFAGLEGQYAASTLPRPDYFTPQGGGQADSEFLAALHAISAATDRNTGMIDPQLLQSYSKMLGIDMSPLITSGAVAGDQYKQLAAQGQGLSQTMMGQGNAISNAAFDPQNQLHDYLQQQTIDQSRAGDAARGINMGGASAGNEATALRNFNLDWQNRQLGRNIEGSQAAQGAYGAGYNYAAGVPGATMQAAATPIQAQTTAYGAPMAFSNQFSGAEANAYAPYGQVMQYADPYMRLATGAGANQYDQRLGREMDVYNMLNKAQGQLNMGYDYKSGAGNPLSYMGMGGAGGGGGGGISPSSMMG